MKKYNVLLTGTSSYGVGEGLIKVINTSLYREQINLIGASNSNLTAFKNMVDKYYVLPNAIDKSYFDCLKKLVEKENIDILIPGSEAEMEVLSKNKGCFSNIDLWVNDYEIIDLFNDKKKASDFFQQNRFYIPQTYSESLKIEFSYPLILKPCRGKSSENIYIVKNKEQLEAVKSLYKAYDTKYIIQKYIENKEEYTMSLINLSKTKQQIFILKRILNKGATQYAVIEENVEIKNIALRLHEILKKELILNIQLIKDKDRYCIIEVNPRFSGSSPMRQLLGFNEFDVIFSSKYLNKDLMYKTKENSYVIRGYKEFVYEMHE